MVGTAVKKVAPWAQASRQKVLAEKRPSAGRMMPERAARGASRPAGRVNVASKGASFERGNAAAELELSTRTWMSACGIWGWYVMVAVRV